MATPYAIGNPSTKSGKGKAAKGCVLSFMGLVQIAVLEFRRVGEQSRQGETENHYYT